MSSSEALLKAIDAFLTDSGMSASTFGLRAINDGTLVARLKNGAGTTIRTADRIQAFIATERAKLATDKRPARRERRAAA